MPTPRTSCTLLRTLCSFALALVLCPLHAAPIEFGGNLEIIEFDNGGVFTGADLGTEFSGTIDDVTSLGSLSNGIDTVEFTSCCLAAETEISNNISLDSDTANALNALVGSNQFSEGQILDSAEIEGDATTSQGGRIEYGLSYLFAADMFADESLNNIPFNTSSALLSLFFIYEEDQFGNDLFSAQGRLKPIPIPAALWLLGPALLGLYWSRVSSHKKR